MKTIWSMVIEGKSARWLFDTYAAVKTTVKENFGVDLPPESQVTDKSRLGYQIGKVWVQIDAVPLYTKEIKLPEVK